MTIDETFQRFELAIGLPLDPRRKVNSFGDDKGGPTVSVGVHYTNPYTNPEVKALALELAEGPVVGGNRQNHVMLTISACSGRICGWVCLQDGVYLCDGSKKLGLPTDPAPIIERLRGYAADGKLPVRGAERPAGPGETAA